MGLYEELKADADALLQELGQEMVLVRPGTGQSHDPVTGAVSNAPDQQFYAFGVEIEYENKDVDGTIVKVGDKRVILQAVEPIQTGDRLRYGLSTSWSIVGWKAVAPAGLALIYELQVRR
ncbi:hypothetical protein 19_00015 [Pseudomonas phage Epa19]|nr:hypothetical protein 19_00015 [Pseudomonas phage Epa19]